MAAPALRDPRADRMAEGAAMRKRTARKPIPWPTYSRLEELLASPDHPLPQDHQTRHLTAMNLGLQALARGEHPTEKDWRLCADPCNLLETLVDLGVIADEKGLIRDAMVALDAAAQRYRTGGALRLDGPGIQAVTALLADYTEVIAQVDARTMIRCYRATIARIGAIHHGGGRPHDIEVTAP